MFQTSQASSRTSRTRRDVSLRHISEFSTPHPSVLLVVDGTVLNVVAHYQLCGEADQKP